MRQALSHNRPDLYQYDTDVVQSIRMRKAALEAEDLAATPLSDQSKRLLYGDTPLFMEVFGGHVLWLQVTEAQLRAYAYCCRNSGSAGDGGSTR